MSGIKIIIAPLENLAKTMLEIACECAYNKSDYSICWLAICLNEEEKKEEEEEVQGRGGLQTVEHIVGAKRRQRSKGGWRRGEGCTEKDGHPSYYRFTRDDSKPCRMVESI
ncbi:hypothetical protein M0804_003597 [Polistes exclamans]|nr:hypothetical protein M0804_003597 [Polistes exclamans]